MDASLNVSELFYSLQGEGGRAGAPSLFIRLQGCSAKFACLASGVLCDTEYESGRKYNLAELSLACLGITGGQYVPIIWTGGEPLDQLTADHIEAMRKFGWYYHAIETSGVKPVSISLRDALDWITLSPKVAEHVLAKHFEGIEVEELRYVRHVGQQVPKTSVRAELLYLSPHSDGHQINGDNLRHVIDLCLAHPEWRLSVQQHKLWRVL